MKKYRGKIIGYTLLAAILAWIGSMVCEQIDAYNAYPKEPIAIETIHMDFGSTEFSQRIEFASSTIRYQAELLMPDIAEVEEDAPAFLWFVKQGARVIQEMPIDGIERQTDKGRIGTYTLSFGEIWAPLVPTLEEQGYFMQGRLTYKSAYWPEWANPESGWSIERIDAYLYDIGIYRRTEDDLTS